MADRRTPKRKNETEPKATKKARVTSDGRQLHDGNTGRLVNADEDEVLEVDSDEEGGPAHRLYQRGSMGGSNRIDTTSVRRSSLEHASNSSRSSRRSSGSAAASSSSSGVPAFSSSTSRRSTSSAATTPQGRGRRSTRIQDQHSQQSITVSTSQSSNNNVVLAPAALAFNQANEDYDPPGNEQYVPPAEVVDEKEVTWADRVVRVVLVIVVVCIIAVYVRSALSTRPTHISTRPTHFKHVPKSTNTISNSTTTLQLAEELEAQRLQLESINAQLQHTDEQWDRVVLSAEESVNNAHLSDAQVNAIEQLNALSQDATTLETHLSTLQKEAVNSTTLLNNTLYTLHTEELVEYANFTTALHTLTPAVVNLTLQVQELNVLVQSGVSVLQAVVADLPHHNATTATDATSDAVVDVESALDDAKAAEAHLIRVSFKKQANITLLNSIAAATHTIGEFNATRESASLQQDEAIKVQKVEQAASIARAAASVEAAKEAAAQNLEVKAQFAATIAQRQREAERIELEEQLAAQEQQILPLNPQEATRFVHAAVLPILHAATVKLYTAGTEEVSSGLREQVDSAKELNRRHNIDTESSDIVKDAARDRKLAQAKLYEALHTIPTHATEEDDTTTNTAAPEIHDYAVGPRGGRVVHHRKTHSIKQSVENRLRKLDALTTAPYKPSGGVADKIKSTLTGRHSANKKHIVFPKSVNVHEVVNHHRPTVENFYPLPIHTSSNAARGTSVTAYTVQSDGKSSVVSSASQLTVMLLRQVRVHSVKLVHTTRNTSSDGGVDGSSVQACAPYRVRFVGWVTDPTTTHSTAVDLGAHTFDAFTASTDYLLSESSGERTAVFEQTFDVAKYVRSRCAGTSGSGEVPVLRAVTLQVLSNHGEELFTCVHRIRVMGEILPEQEH